MTHPGSIVPVGIAEAEAIIAEDVPDRRIRIVVGHHFWRPSARQYRGPRTMRAVRRYHTEKCGWRDVGYNWLFAPNGDIFTGRSLESGSGAHCVGHNYDGVGLGMCLDGDREPLTDFPEMKSAVLGVTAALCRAFGLDQYDLHWHSDFSRKSCPGRLLDRAVYRDLLGELLRHVEPTPWVRLKLDDARVPDVPLHFDRVHGQVLAAREFMFSEPASVAGQVIRTGESIRGWLEAHDYHLPAGAWHPEQSAAGTVYGYR